MAQFVNEKNGEVSGLVTPGSEHDAAAAIQERFVQTVRLEHVLLQRHAPARITFLAVDVEGADAVVVSDSLLDTYLFDFVLIERPHIQTSTRMFKHGYLFSQHFLTTLCLCNPRTPRRETCRTTRPTHSFPRGVVLPQRGSGWDACGSPGRAGLCSVVASPFETLYDSGQAMLDHLRDAHRIERAQFTKIHTRRKMQHARRAPQVPLIDLKTTRAAHGLTDTPAGTRLQDDKLY